MTLTTTINRNDYTATASQTIFAYQFRILADSDLQVYVNSTLKTLTTDYTVSGAGDAGGGNVTFNTGLTADDAVLIIRVEPLTQATDYTASGSFPAETHEQALDKLTMHNQDLDEKLGRTVKFPVTSTLSDIDFPSGSSATDRGGKVPAWNTAGDDLELVSPTTVDSVSLIAVKGDLIQGDANGDAEKLAIGSNGDTLQVVSGKAAWATQPTIADFTNATHDHSDAANGGTLPSSALTNYRAGLNCKQASATTITVEAGEIVVAGTTVSKTADTTLTLTTATDWVDDTSDQATDTYGYIYINASGKIEMDNVAPDESDTSGGTSGILRYNDTGTDTTDRRCIGWFYMNATGAGELNAWEVGNLKDGDVHNAVVRTDSTQDTLNDTSYGTDITNTTVHFYSSGRGPVRVGFNMNCSTTSANILISIILDDGSNIAATEMALRDPVANTGGSVITRHAEYYAQGVYTFKIQGKVSSGSALVEEKTMIIEET